MLVFREMSRYPIKDHTNIMLMHIIYKVCKIIRCSITGCRCIVACHLIPPGTIKRMLHHRHQFYMGISHFFTVLTQQRCHLLVCIEAVPLFSSCKLWFLKGPQCHFVHQHRFFFTVPFTPSGKPFLIFPAVFCQIPYHTGCSRSEFCIVCKRICF